MAPLKVIYKVHNSKLSFSSEKSESKLNIKPKEIVSKVKSSKLFSKIKTLVKREKVTFGPKTWMDHWTDNAPVISASKEFYGLPQAIIELLWTYVIKNDGEKQSYYMKPSLLASVYHYDSSKVNLDEGFKVKMTGARTLLRINSFSRSLALKKFSGTVPIFYVPYNDNGILRFDPKRDIIHIRNFHYLAHQMTPTVGKGLMLHLEYQYFAHPTARELLKFHPKFRHVRKLMWIERQTKYIYPLKQRKKSLEACQLAQLLNKLWKIHELPGWTWDHSTSIQNLAIDYSSLCKSIIIIHKLMDSVNTNTTSAGRMPEFTAEFGPVSNFFKFLREVGNVQNIRAGDNEWHKLSDDELFNTMLDGESALLGL
ncbi:uncharacterized protein Bfra_010405 [Botrytis fragariae]|uniref:Uncharacterized protein n=1 Tax=Botrytis fragariae TaxID=1964551 RepID=A0A8H6AF30_9HELO|nr:uncharacterized protein Bfra_010405 [Botrytis fragariae]KAF5867431.1 hypothetical protein Bfra_010405 [Botrytis fragariae]